MKFLYFQDERKETNKNTHQNQTSKQNNNNKNWNKTNKTCFFRSDFLDKQLSYVQGWKESVFPAAKAVSHTLGNLPKSLLCPPDFLIALLVQRY